MSSKNYLLVDGSQMIGWDEDTQPTMLMLYSQADRREYKVPGVQRDDLYEDDDGNATVVELAVSPQVIKDRLDVLGLGKSVVVNTLLEVFRDHIEFRENYIKEHGDKSGYSRREMDYLRPLDFDLWCQRLREAEARRRERGGDDHIAHVGGAAWLMNLLSEMDQRYVIRAVVEAFSDAKEITLDVSNLAEANWVPAGESPRQAALDHFEWFAYNGSPTVILTEGRNDAKVLNLAIQVLKPHLQDFLKVAEFSQGQEGNASFLVKTIRSFVSAGIGNRVVALFDNDSAATDALRVLDLTTLPSNISVIQLPELDLAKSYPTLGPGGLVDMDINGLACSMELFLGRDVLAYVGGDPIPIQWTGFVKSLNRYQGEILEKQQIHEAFETKAGQAIADPQSMSGQDWSSLELLLGAILEVLGKPRS